MLAHQGSTALANADSDVQLRAIHRDSLDSQDSSLIFDLVFPTTAASPFMSRRVFDVGLDIGRIKNGLKVSKSEKPDTKRTKGVRSASTPITAYTDESPYLNQQLAIVPRMHHKKSSPTMRALDTKLAPITDTVLLPSPGSPQSTDFPIPPSRHSPPHVDSSSPDASMGFGQLPSPGDQTQNFDLRPPPPNKPVRFLDTLSERLFSDEHLKVIIHDPSFFLRFTAFLNRYKPYAAPILVRYLEAQKAIKAVEYANALADSIKPLPGEHSSQIPCAAATIDSRFEARGKRALDSLVHDALPAYVTFGLVKVVTETIVREITGTAMPVMRELVSGSAEVFCLSDPSLKDNPIVYASEEFYRTTQYGRDYVIGKNCRFLQGPKTDRQCVERIKSAVKDGQEVFETILNYRRDGSPFMNLVMVAPLYDNRGTVRYFIGAQIDVTGLIEDGRGLDSFERVLSEGKRGHRNRDSEVSFDDVTKKPLKTLNEFGQMLSVDEKSALHPHSRSNSMVQDNASSVNHSVRGTTGRRDPSLRHPRRVVLGTEEDEERRDAWALPSIGPSGKLPGVYQNYLLVRPYPSLRIIFVSSALRIPGLLQSPFLSRIGGPSHVRDGLSDAFEKGDSVTAKVMWLPQGRPQDSNDIDGNGGSRPGSRHGGGHMQQQGVSRARYISCTPLLGSDDQVGVWMVVMVENEQVTGSLPSRHLPLHSLNQSAFSPSSADGRYAQEVPPTPSHYEREDSSPVGGRETEMRGRGLRGDKIGGMYADWMKGQGHPRKVAGNLGERSGGEAMEWDGSGNGAHGGGFVEGGLDGGEGKDRF